MRLYKRADSSVWWGEWTDPDGKHCRRSTRCRDKGAASRALREWVQRGEREYGERLAGLTPIVAVSLLDSAAEFLAAMRLERQPRYVDALEAHLALRILPFLGEDSPLTGLTPGRLEDLRRAIRAEGVSPATVNRHLVTVRRWLAFCVSRSWLRQSPAVGLRQLRERTEERHRALTPDELARWVAALGETRNGREHVAHVRFLVATGLREGEAAQLRWADVRRDLTPPVVHVRAATAKDAARRNVPLTAAALEALAELPGGVGLVFGVRDRRTAWSNAWHTAGLAGRVPSPHDLRHTFASWAVGAGLDIRELQTVLGHDSIATTERYVHTYGDALARMAEKMRRA